MACRPLGLRGGPLASGAYGDQGRLSFGHRSANMECILRSDVRSAGYQEMQSKHGTLFGRDHVSKITHENLPKSIARKEREGRF